MKDLIIIGAGGFGRVVYQLATECHGFQREYSIKGFLDDNLNALDGFSNYPKIINSISNYDIQKNDLFACSIGNVVTKKKIINTIHHKGGCFVSLIHPTTHIGNNAQLGDGLIIMRNAVIGSDSKIGNYSLIQIAAVIGHDAHIGEYARIDCHVVCVGGTTVHDEVAIHTSAVINENVIIEKGAVIGAGSFVIRNVKEQTTVYGNPAKKL